MSNVKQRVQALLSNETVARIKALAEDRGLSTSAMTSQLIHIALDLDQFRPPVTRDELAKVKGEAVQAAIMGGDIHDHKMQALIKLIDEMSS